MDEAGRASGIRFARRIWLPRAAGFALGFLSFGSVLWEREASAGLWAGLALSCFAWPHLAYAIARTARDPVRAERGNLIADCLGAGLWIALTGFSLIPMALAVSILGTDRMSIGGARFAAAGLGTMLLGALACGFALGTEVQLHSSMATIVASLPVMILYPLSMGGVVFRSTTRVREQNRRLAELSRIDGLSRLLNHPTWHDAVAAEFERARRHDRLATVLMLDIDNFKQINDRHGHFVGDEVIRRVSDILRDCARRADVVGRCGGEEFGIVLPETGAEAAMMTAERIRARIESEPLCDAPPVRATVSIGIAPLPGDGVDDAIRWVVTADRALYEAKRLGRNRCVCLAADPRVEDARVA